jgi:hypothetical protein
MIERVTLRPARPLDLAFCEQPYFEGMDSIVEAPTLDTAKQPGAAKSSKRKSRIVRRSRISNKVELFRYDNDINKEIRQIRSELSPVRYAPVAVPL